MNNQGDLVSTSNLELLVKRFSQPGVRFDRGQGGLPRMHICTEEVTGELYLQGGHVTAFCPRGATPVLWMSRESYFETGKPIRGGVPICFPWFGPNAADPKLPGHGWARLREWDISHIGATIDQGIVVRMRTMIDEYVITFQVSFSQKLAMELTVCNMSDSSYAPPFEAALHSYFSVQDVRNIDIFGLENCAYVDKVGGARQCEATGSPITFTAETDRVYQNTPAACRLVDPGFARAIHIRKWGSLSTVVWNPWIEKSKRMPDYGDDEWPGMVCIETANVGEHAIRLGPGQTHTMIAEIRVESLS